MKKAIFILIVLLLSVLYYMGFLTRKETLPFSEEFFSAETPSTERIWEERRGFPSGKRELDQLHQLTLEKGIRNLPVLSSFLSREAERAREKGDSQRAADLAEYSAKLSPDLPQAHFELARDYWHRNPFGIGRILSEFLEGQKARFRHFQSSVHLAYGFSYILFNAMLMAFMVFGILVMIKYLPLYFHGIRRDIIRGISRVLVNSLKVFFLFIPFLLRLDILWAVLFWSILLWGYATRWEKRLLVVFLILLVYLPFFLRSASAFLNEPASDIVFEMSQANGGDSDKGTEEKLRAWLANHPDDAEVIFTLGLIEKRRGRYAQAEELYQKAIQANPRFSEALSNLGNIYLAQRKVQPAIDMYQQAILFDPMKASYYYNLHRAFSQETFLSKKTEEAFQRARQLDPELVDAYAGIDSAQIERLLIDETLTPRQLWTRSLDHFSGKEGFLFRLLLGWFDRLSSAARFVVPAVFLGLMIGMSRFVRTKRFLTRCPMCGSTTHRLYAGSSEHEFICFNCYRIFIQKEKLHPRITERKSFQVRQFHEENERIGGLVSLFFGGFAFLWRGASLKGLLFLFLFFIFVLRFIYWEGVIPLAYSWSSFSLWRTVGWGGLFLLFYLFSLRQVRRLKPRVEGGK